MSVMKCWFGDRTPDSRLGPEVRLVIIILRSIQVEVFNRYPVPRRLRSSPQCQFRLIQITECTADIA